MGRMWQDNYDGSRRNGTYLTKSWNQVRRPPSYLASSSSQEKNQSNMSVLNARLRLELSRKEKWWPISLLIRFVALLFSTAAFGLFITSIAFDHSHFDGRGVINQKNWDKVMLAPVSVAS
jgi:hypothetical protein